jgi:hypothetical protein
VAEPKPILELGGPKRFDNPTEFHQVIVELGRWGIASPASDLEWLRNVIGSKWRWEAVGAVGQLIEPHGRRYGIFLQHLLSLVPALRSLSICKGFDKLVPALVNESAYDATVFELNVAMRVMQNVSPFHVEFGPDVVVKGRHRQADFVLNLPERVWIECKSVQPLEQSAIKSRLERLGDEFKRLVMAQAVPEPSSHVGIHLNVGDGKSFERRIPILASSLGRLVRANGWQSLMDKDVDPTGKTWPAAGREARPGMAGVREPPVSPSRTPLNFYDSMDWTAWQSRKVADFIKEALDQLPAGEPQIVCIQTPNPKVHIQRAEHWIKTSPRGQNVAVVLMDHQGVTASWVSRLGSTDGLAAVLGPAFANP